MLLYVTLSWRRHSLGKSSFTLYLAREQMGWKRNSRLLVPILPRTGISSVTIPGTLAQVWRLCFQTLKIFTTVLISCGFPNKIKYQGQVKQQSMKYFISPHFLLLKEHEKHLRAVCRVHLPSNMTSRLIGMKENVTLDYNCPLRVLSLMLLLLCSATLWGKTQRRALLSTGACS